MYGHAERWGYRRLRRWPIRVSLVWVLGDAKCAYMPHDANEKEKGERRRAASRRGGLLSTRFLLVLFYFILVFIGLGFLSLKYFLVVGWLAALAG